MNALLVLVVLSGEPLPPDYRAISLDDAAKAPLIVAGQVARLEHVGNRPFATLEVDYIGRGDAGTSIQFYADPQADCCQPSAVIGRHHLVFLERAPGEPVRWQLVGRGAGAVSLTKLPTGSIALGSHYGGVHFPKSLCDTSLSKDPDDCVQRLSGLLDYLKLPAMRPSDAPPTFRIASRTCPPCELTDGLTKLRVKGETDCSPGDVPLQEQCTRHALAKHAAFNLTLRRPGIDSALSMAFHYEGSKIEVLNFDSSVEGGPGCAAVVTRRSCTGIQRAGDSFECVKPGPVNYLCDQTKSRVESLTDPVPLSKLRCAGGDPRDCVLGSDAGTPPTTSGDLLCFGDADSLRCR